MQFGISSYILSSSLFPSLASSLPSIPLQEAGDRALVDRKHVTERGVLILAVVLYGLATALVASTLAHRFLGGGGGKEAWREGGRKRHCASRVPSNGVRGLKR